MAGKRQHYWVYHRAVMCFPGRAEPETAQEIEDAPWCGLWLKIRKTDRALAAVSGADPVLIRQETRGGSDRFPPAGGSRQGSQ